MSKLCLDTYHTSVYELRCQCQTIFIYPIQIRILWVFTEILMALKNSSSIVEAIIFIFFITVSLEWKNILILETIISKNFL